MAYTHRNSYYSLGYASYWKDVINTTLWAYAEQSVSPAIRVLVGYSHAFAAKAVCKDFFGLGLYYQHNKCELGAFSDYARFSNAHEFAMEISFKYQATASVSLQPVLHLIATSSVASACRTSFFYISTIRVGVAL